MMEEQRNLTAVILLLIILQVFSLFKSLLEMLVLTFSTALRKEPRASTNQVVLTFWS